MPPNGPKTDHDALRLMKSAAILLGAWAFLHQVGKGSRSAMLWLIVGLLSAVVTWLLPGVVLPIARPLYRALVMVGDIVSNVLLTLVYLLLVYPWQRFLRLLGRIEPDEEPWPPPESSTWRPADLSTGSISRRARPGSWAATILTQAGGSVALVRYVYQRPSAFVIPVLVLMLLLAALILVGHTTGLGPLAYTLF